MFEILEFTEAKIAVQNRTEKHGDDEVPAVTLGFEIVARNTMLDLLCPGLRHALFKAVEGQDDLPGVDPSTPVLRSNVIDIVKLTTAHEGWRLLIDDGIDETTPMAFSAGKIDKFTVEPKQGGSTVYRFKYGTSDVDADRLGKLGMHNGQSVWIKALKPEKPAADATEATGAAIDGTTGHPGAADGQGSLLDEGAAGDGAGDGLGGFDDDMARGGDASIDPAAAGDEAEDGGADEQAAIEAGMAQAVASAGLKPKRGGRKTGAGVH